MTTGVANMFKVVWVILYASLEKLVDILNQVSSEYREVSRQLAKDKEQKKMERQVSDIVSAGRLLMFYSLYMLNGKACITDSLQCSAGFPV